MKIKISNANTPTWKDVTVKSRIPEELKKLEELARNIWWAWNYEAIELFRDLDPALWKEAGQNPVVLLERLSYETLEKLAKLSKTKLNEYLAFSNQFCGISVQQHGAFDSYPTLDQMQ